MREVIVPSVTLALLALAWFIKLVRQPPARDVSETWVRDEEIRLRRAGYEGVSFTGKFKR